MAPDDAGFNSLTKDRKKECVYPNDFSMLFQSLTVICAMKIEEDCSHAVMA